MKRFNIFFVFWAGLFVTFASGKVKVTSLHPLITDLVQQIGGDKVEVVGLLKDQGAVHSFKPTSRDLQKTLGSKIYFASGKGLETYLPKFRKMVGGAKVVEVGRKIISITVSKENKVYTCCPGHNHGSLDPHWWHSLSNWRKAADIVTDALSEADPENKAYYSKNERIVKRKFAILNSWVKKQLVQIPKSKRQLATAHAAYGYFCKEYGFKSIPVQGLNKEQKPSSVYMQTVINNLKKHKVVAIFPEYGNNDKSLKSVANSAGVKLGDPLYPDGAESIDTFFKTNVTSIVKALK